jgi:PIN domain nuclease of toxin-antitoxin system
VNLLLDTHVFLWIVNGGPLTEAVKNAYTDLGNNLYFSAVSYWEICIKISIGKLVLSNNWPQLFDVEIKVNEIQWLPIEPAHCRNILNLPPLHKDPFDRLLIAQALSEQMTIITTDRDITNYPVSTLW